MSALVCPLCGGHYFLEHGGKPCKGAEQSASRRQLSAEENSAWDDCAIVGGYTPNASDRESDASR
jgi:hypothetical protein